MAGKREAGGDEEEAVDHYAVLGLPSGEEGATLTLKEIERAYKIQSRARHPDKRPDDPGATADFQSLRSSFDLLRDPTARAAFDARLRARADAARRDLLRDSKRRRATTDLEERERAAARAEADPAERAHRREKQVAAELQRELAEFQARNSKTPTTASPMSRKEKEEENTRKIDEEERTLKVSWHREGGNYSFERLKEMFERFGQVEDIVIMSRESKKRGSALIVMSTKDAAVAATQNMSGDLANPLLVLPLRSTTCSTSSTSLADPINPKLSKVVGAGFRDYESSIMEKLKKAKEKKGVK